jgi:hypothetical protein
MKIPFKRIWSEKRYDLKHWLFYNLLISLSPIWLSCLFLAFGKVFRFLDPFLDGRLLIFTATLSGASMNFFVTDTKLNLRNTERFLFNGLLAAIFLGAGGYTAIVTLNQFSPGALWSPVVVLTTIIALGLAVYFNLYLAGVRSVYTDQELMRKLIEEEQDVLVKEKKVLAETARTASEVDGARL